MVEKGCGTSAGIRRRVGDTFGVPTVGSRGCAAALGGDAGTHESRGTATAAARIALHFAVFSMAGRLWEPPPSATTRWGWWCARAQIPRCRHGVREDCYLLCGTQRGWPIVGATIPALRRDGDGGAHTREAVASEGGEPIKKAPPTSGHTHTHKLGSPPSLRDSAWPAGRRWRRHSA